MSFEHLLGAQELQALIVPCPVILNEDLSKTEYLYDRTWFNEPSKPSCAP